MVQAIEPHRVKMSVFAERAGVPIPTIKHYLREGLLPQPMRTSKNMAYYDSALIPRVRAIKRLQSEMYLPLRVIRRVLDRLEDDEITADVALEATVARVLGDLATKDALSRRQATAAGLEGDELDALEMAGLVEIDGTTYRDDDASLLRTLAQARRAGITDAMVPPAALERYLDALSALVRAEVDLFREGVGPQAGDDLHRLAETAIPLSERLLVLLRRKLMVPILRERLSPTTPEDTNPRP